MIDALRRKIRPGNYIAYAVKSGKTPELVFYQVKEVYDDKVKCIAVHRRCDDVSVELKNGKVIPVRHTRWYTDAVTKEYARREMTPKEKKAVDNKLWTLRNSKQAFILDDFYPSVFS